MVNRVFFWSLAELILFLAPQFNYIKIADVTRFGLLLDFVILNLACLKNGEMRSFLDV